MLKKGDKIIALILAVLIIGGLGYQYIIGKREIDEKVVEIKINGELYEAIPLKDIQEPMMIKIDNNYGINDIRIDGEGAEVVHANCPDQVCVRTGKIEKPGPIIACLPHRLSVEIVGQTEDGIDAISQ